MSFMKAILVIDMPDSYADRYNINEMYVWDLVVQDKNGYQMFDLTTDKPNHLKPMPERKDTSNRKITYEELRERIGWNTCLEEIEK